MAYRFERDARSFNTVKLRAGDGHAVVNLVVDQIMNQNSNDKDQNLKVVCAWCGVTIREGGDGADVSHGICALCFEREVDKLNDVKGEDHEKI